MDVSFLVDPIHKSVTSVQDGYARAGELIGTDLTDTATLWGDAADSDTSSRSSSRTTASQATPSRAAFSRSRLRWRA